MQNPPVLKCLDAGTRDLLAAMVWGSKRPPSLGGSGIGGFCMGATGLSMVFRASWVLPCNGGPAGGGGAWKGRGKGRKQGGAAVGQALDNSKDSEGAAGEGQALGSGDGLERVEEGQPDCSGERGVGDAPEGQGHLAKCDQGGEGVLGNQGLDSGLQDAAPGNDGAGCVITDQGAGGTAAGEGVGGSPSHTKSAVSAARPDQPLGLSMPSVPTSAKPDQPLGPGHVELVMTDGLGTFLVVVIKELWLVRASKRGECTSIVPHTPCPSFNPVPGP